MKNIICIVLLFSAFVLKAQNNGLGTFSNGDSCYISSGANKITLGTKSALRLYGNTTVWNDMFGTVNRHMQGSSGYPTFVEDSVYLTFLIDSTTGSRNIVFQAAQLPHDWKPGSNLHLHVHIRYTTAQGTPTLVLKYKWFNLNASTIYPACPWKWWTIQTATSTTNFSHSIIEDVLDVGIDGAGKTLASFLICQLYLKSTTGATKSCFVYSIDFHYEINSLGSDTEYKN